MQSKAITVAVTPVATPAAFLIVLWFPQAARRRHQSRASAKIKLNSAHVSMYDHRRGLIASTTQTFFCYTPYQISRDRPRIHAAVSLKRQRSRRADGERRLTSEVKSARVELVVLMRGKHARKESLGKIKTVGNPMELTDCVDVTRVR
jgi:hypothetical protein